MAVAVIVGVQPASAERSASATALDEDTPKCTVTPKRTIAVIGTPDVDSEALTSLRKSLEEDRPSDFKLLESVDVDGEVATQLLNTPEKRGDLVDETKVGADVVILVVGKQAVDGLSVAKLAGDGVVFATDAQLLDDEFDQAELSGVVDLPLVGIAASAREVPRTVRVGDDFELAGPSGWSNPVVHNVTVDRRDKPDEPLLCQLTSIFTLPAVVRVTGLDEVKAEDLSVDLTVGLGETTTIAPPLGATTITVPAAADKANGKTGATGDDSLTRFWPAAVVALAAAIGALAFALYTRSRALSSTPVGVPGAGGFLPAPPMHGNGGPVVAPHPARYFEEPVMEHSAPVPPAPGWTAAIPGGTAIRASDLGLLRVAPHLTARGHSWSHATSRWVLASGWVEKVVGKGEDAEPVMRVHDSGRGLLAVFDGTGGAGSASARRLPDGSDLSGAYVASRLAREVSESWFTQLIASGSGARPDPAQLQDQLARALQDEMTYPDVPQSIVKGRLQRILPTTLAGVAFASTGEELQIEAMWAGDSRCYALTVDKGLQVLTIDDTPETDALALIRNDQPMSNLVCADRPFAINRLGYRLAQPAMLVTATDGCFGYVRTPAHFEYLILKTLMDSPGPQEWADQLIEAVAAIASDDCSFSLAGVGFGDFVTMREMLRPRFTFLTDNHWAPFQRAQSNEEIEALRIGSWESYRNTYHELALQDAQR